jgi:hypothetical protein
MNLVSEISRNGQGSTAIGSLPYSAMLATLKWPQICPQCSVSQDLGCQFHRETTRNTDLVVAGPTAQNVNSNAHNVHICRVSVNTIAGDRNPISSIIERITCICIIYIHTCRKSMQSINVTIPCFTTL